MSEFERSSLEVQFETLVSDFKKDNRELYEDALAALASMSNITKVEVQQLVTGDGTYGK